MPAVGASGVERDARPRIGPRDPRGQRSTPDGVEVLPRADRSPRREVSRHRSPNGESALTVKSRLYDMVAISAAQGPMAATT
jgi:hypothetical protein